MEHDRKNKEKIEPGAKRGFGLNIADINLRSYNILNFLKEQKIEMNFTNKMFDGEYKVTSNSNLLKHVRIAKHWNENDDKGEKPDAFAINYSH